jgi:ABC-type nitrate/sulfonate/bicarbonate transport system substrate-binding protein
MTSLTIAVPDLVSNSYFPAIAAVALGISREEGLDLELKLLFPVDAAYRALRRGELAFVAGSAHSVPAAFPDWEGAKLLAALSQGTYWFLVMRADIAGARGDLSVVKGRRIGAAPMVELGLRRILADSHIDLAADRVEIVPIPGSSGSGISFGVNAARALEAGLIDGFWANGMGAEVAVRGGFGKIILDVRRGDGARSAFHYTLPALVTTAAFFDAHRETAQAAVRAVRRTQTALAADAELASLVGKALFPAWEAEHIAGVITRDLPYYDPSISRPTFESIARFALEMGLAARIPRYENIVAPTALEPAVPGGIGFSNK